jgi:V8-like Glu-specific endopeptidase
MMMTKRFITLLLASFLSITLIGYWANVSAQTPAKPETLPPIPMPKPIAITFNSKSDGTTFRPLDRPQSDNPFDPGDRAIVGKDERLPVRSRSFPWSAIGKIETESYSCTGTLISKDLVLTNAHCLIENIDSKTGKLKQPIFFFPSMKEGKILEKEPAKVIAFDYGQGYKKGETWTEIADDWAIFKINKPLGDKYGYLGWRNLSLSDAAVLKNLNSQSRLAGYSADFPNQKLREQLNLAGDEGDTAGVHTGCSIDAIDSGVILHNCDSMGGASGSSLIALFNDGKYYIVGLHRGSVDLKPDQIPPEWQERCQRFEDGKKITVEACRNLGVDVSRWASKAISLRQTDLR